MRQPSNYISWIHAFPWGRRGAEFRLRRGDEMHDDATLASLERASNPARRHGAAAGQGKKGASTRTGRRPSRAGPEGTRGRRVVEPSAMGEVKADGALTLPARQLGVYGNVQSVNNRAIAALKLHIMTQSL